MSKSPAWLLAALVVFLGVRPSAAQELNCDVSVNISQLQGTEYEFLQREFSEQIETYLNTQAWTDDTFLPEERIECAITVVISEATGMNDFRAQLTIQSRRPVYGAPSQVQVFQHQDGNWGFTYVRNQALTRNLDRYDALSSMLDFYALLMVGFDYDTFSDRGGTPMFEQAQEVVAIAESAGGAGWGAIGDERSRGALVQQLLTPRMQPLRTLWFDYHFGALDRFLTRPDEARLAAMNVLEALQELQKEENRRTYLMDLFLTSKVDEIVALFEGSSYARQVFDTLMAIDPSRSSKYAPLQS